MGELWYSSNIIDLRTRWRWVVRFNPRPLYPQGKSRPYSLCRRLGGPQIRSGPCRPLSLAVNRTYGVQPETHRYPAKYGLSRNWTALPLYLLLLRPAQYNAGRKRTVQKFVTSIKYIEKFLLPPGSTWNARYILIYSVGITTVLRLISNVKYSQGIITPMLTQ
jgi:hypothetical protein